jgi:hypothetical protein
MSKKKQKDLPVVDLSGDENDDWLKKAHPRNRQTEIEIHERLEREQKEKSKGENGEKA